MMERKLEEALNKTYGKFTDSYASAVKSVQNASPLATPIDKKSRHKPRITTFSKVSAIAQFQKTLKKQKMKI